MLVNDPQAADVRLRASHRQRLIDPLLPDRVDPLPGCDERFFATASDGTLIATGQCEHWTGEPGSLELVWGARRRFRLIPEIAGPDVADALGQLISQWREQPFPDPPADRAEHTPVRSSSCPGYQRHAPLLDRRVLPAGTENTRVPAR